MPDGERPIEFDDKVREPGKAKSPQDREQEERKVARHNPGQGHESGNCRAGKVKGPRARMAVLAQVVGPELLKCPAFPHSMVSQGADGKLAANPSQGPVSGFDEVGELLGVAAVVRVKLKSLLSEEGHDLDPGRRRLKIERAAFPHVGGRGAKWSVGFDLSPSAFQLALGPIRIEADPPGHDAAVLSEFGAVQSVEFARNLNKDARPRHLDNRMGRPPVLWAETVGG